MNTWWKQYLTSPLITALGRQKELLKFSKPPVIIGGCARSGTSMLLSMLSAHPSIHAIPVETDAFTHWDLVGRPMRIDRFYRELLKARIKPNSNRWCEKRPYNVRYIAEILRYFGENVRFIHIIRDPRAVCTSRHPEKPDSYWVPPDRYVHDVTLGLAYENHPSVHSLKFEELIQNEKEELRKVCEFIDEPFEMNIENWMKHATVRTNRAWFQPLQNVSLRNWTEPEHSGRLKELESHTSLINLMHKLGYH